MERRSVAILAVGVVAVVAIAAIAFGPMGLVGLSTPWTNLDQPANGDNTGDGPRPNAFEMPSWHEGDRWTYEVNASSSHESPVAAYEGAASATGNLTRTVVSADETMYNVSVEATFHAQWMLNPTPDEVGASGSTMLDDRMSFKDVTVDGYTWYRTSDLAILKEVRTVAFGGSFQTDSGSYNVSYTATVETTYDPAFDVWAFPLDANDTWNATSNATVHVMTNWTVESPHGAWGFWKDLTFTRPVRLFLMSGAPEAIVTPAGTFPSIPVRIGLPHIDREQASDHTEGAEGLDHDVPVARDHSVEAWWSGTAKNVVQIRFAAWGSGVNLVLTSYHLG